MSESNQILLELTLIFARDKDKFSDEERQIILNTIKMAQRKK